jgi:hypothetical protein
MMPALDLVALGDEQAKRTARAQAALSAGRLLIELIMPDQWRVTNGDNAPYVVRRTLDSDREWKCTCDDYFAKCEKSGLNCKHIAAVRLSLGEAGSVTPCAPSQGQKEAVMDFVLTLLEQIAVLTKWLVPEWAVKKDPKVAHGKPWVFHEFVRLMLDKIFGAAKWAFTGGQFKTLPLANNDHLIYVVGTLAITFDDGSQATRSDVGVGLVQARSGSPDLTDAKPELFETGYKSAATDALKGCAADLGRCFRPMQNGNIAAAVRDGRFDALFPLEGERTMQWQYDCLLTMAPAWAVQQDPLGNPYTAHEYVTECLDVVFTPPHWSFVIGDVSVETLPSGEMLVYVPGTLTVTFAEGSQVTRYDIGIAPIRFKKDRSDLIATPTENYETAFKAAVTDALKGCCGDLGCCFRPMLSKEMEAAVVKGFFDNEFKRLRPVDPAVLEKNKRALGRDDGDLVAAGTAACDAVKVTEKGQALFYGDGTPLSLNKVERATFEEYRQVYQLTPASPNALRVWKKMYCDFTTAPDNPDTRKVYDLFVEQNHGLPPANAVSLKAWYTQIKTQPAAVAA